MGSLPVLETPTYPQSNERKEPKGSSPSSRRRIGSSQKGVKKLRRAFEAVAEGAVLRGFRVPCLECALEALIPLSGWQWPPGCSEFVTTYVNRGQFKKELQSPPIEPLRFVVNHCICHNSRLPVPCFFLAPGFPSKSTKREGTPTATHFFRHPAT